MRSTQSFIDRVIGTNNNRPNNNQSNQNRNNNAQNGGGQNTTNPSGAVQIHPSHHYNEGRGMSLNRAAILGGLPLHQASMIAQESRLMNHQDEDNNGSHSIYSSSFGHGIMLPNNNNTRTSETGGNLGFGEQVQAQIVRNNTISHQPNLNMRGNAGAGNSNLPQGLHANNIFMNDSAPNLFQPVTSASLFGGVAARSNSLVPNQRNIANNNSGQRGDALDEFMQQQFHQPVYNNGLSNTNYGAGMNGPQGALFGSQNQVLSPQFVRPHQYTATYGGISAQGNQRGVGGGLNSLAQAGAAILGQQQQIMPRRVATISDFEVGILGSNSSAAPIYGLLGNPSVGASRIRDEELIDDDEVTQNQAAARFSPYQMNSRMANHLENGDQEDDEEETYKELLAQHNREREIMDQAEQDRHMRHFQNLSQSNKNFVKSIVDDVFARNNQLNQLHLAYSQARSDFANDELLANPSQLLLQGPQGGNIELTAHQEEEISDIIHQALLQQQNLLGINPQNIPPSQRLSSNDDEDEDDSMGGSGMSSDEESDINRRQHEEEEYYLEMEEDRDSNYRGSHRSQQRDDWDQYRRFEHEEIDEEEEDEGNDILQQYQNHQRNEEYEEEEEEGGFTDEQIEHMAAQQAANQLMFIREHHQRHLLEQAFNQEENDNEDEDLYKDDDEEEDEDEQRDNDGDIQQDQEEEDQSESELQKYLRDVEWGRGNRAKTAPIKAAKQAEQFKLTPGFSQLEQAAVCAVQLVQRGDMKFDLDSFEGQNSCKKFLSNIEKLCESAEAKCQNRQYRKKFSNAYKVLYKEGKLCYLTEILDSAQEAFPYLWVNGEKYVFSKEVIEAGRNLFNNFCKILYQVKDAYQRVCEENSYEALIEVIAEVREALEEFDINWVTYEQLYVIELMLIEQDARRYITEAIEIEKEITSAEVREKAKGKIIVDCPEYKKNRSKLIDIFNKINAVANPEGKGRDDLQAEILFTAESLCRKITLSQSKAVRKLAEAIRKSFMDMRQLLRKYEENIEGVDPQLKNNADLVTALVEFEQSWEKGKTYFVNEQKCSQLLHFTQIIEGTSEKYKSFAEQIEDRDTVIFVTIPALLILKNLDDGDDKGICKTFYPPMFAQVSPAEAEAKDDEAFKKYQDLKSHYNLMLSKSKNPYDFYNFVEKCVLEMEESEADNSKSKNREESLAALGMSKNDLQKLVQQIRLLSMQLQRHKPAEWNEFLDVAL